MIKKQHFTHQRGAVSLFVVIFTTLLIATITISFMQLMMKDQQQSMYSDLSESAYDSAVAGVEDAKRALLMEEDCLSDTTPRCVDIRANIDSGECTTLSNIFGGGDGETPIVQTAGDRRLEQAYTCVKITQDTTDYLGTIDSDAEATLIPLRAKGAFNRIRLSWALSKSGDDITVPEADVKTLPVIGAAWPETHPALLRVQLINGRDSFQLSDLDGTGYNSTLFLYPSQSGLATTEFALDGRRGAANGDVQLADCTPGVGSGTYACSVVIDIDPSIGANSQTAFLNLMAFYRATDYKIELLNNNTPVLFDGVQPEVDSTGRANDLFRRVVSRVEMNGGFNFPVAALETRNNICKDFSITNQTSGYQASADCDPTRNNY